MLLFNAKRRVLQILPPVSRVGNGLGAKGGRHRHGQHRRKGRKHWVHPHSRIENGMREGKERGALCSVTSRNAPLFSSRLLLLPQFDTFPSPRHYCIPHRHHRHALSLFSLSFGALSIRVSATASGFTRSRVRCEEPFAGFASASGRVMTWSC